MKSIENQKRKGAPFVGLIGRWKFLTPSDKYEKKYYRRTGDFPLYGESRLFDLLRGSSVKCFIINNLECS